MEQSLFGRTTGKKGSNMNQDEGAMFSSVKWVIILLVVFAALTALATSSSHQSYEMTATKQAVSGSSSSLKSKNYFEQFYK
jgi:hypothetical protein